MDPARRDGLQAIGMAAIIGVFALLVMWLKTAGLIMAIVLVAALAIMMRRNSASPEVMSLRASLSIARDDVAETLELFDELCNGMSADAIADRTLRFPALVDRGTTNPVIQDFHLRADAARRFIGRVDTTLSRKDLDRTQLERLIAIADERAAELTSSWQNARRAALEIGPDGA